MVNNELDLNYIKTKLLNIVKKAHKHTDKHGIKVFDDRFQISCPICGDSIKSPKKYRGNLYFKNLFFKCFNEGCRCTFTDLCKQFNEDIDIDNRIKLYNYVDSHTSFENTNSDYILEEMDKLIDVDTFVEYFNNKPNSWLYDIKPVEKNSHVYHYLKYERYIEDFTQIYQGVYRVIKEGQKVYETKVMINMNMMVSDKKLLGIQLRNLERDKSKRFFKIVDFEELYNYMNPNDKIDEITALPYNKLSHFFNILNIDFEKPINIFEGFIDSLFSSNSLGLIGTNSMDDAMNFLLNCDDEIKIRFFLDNDPTGINKATKFLKSGHTVFLWNKLFNKLVEKAKDKNKAKKIYNNIIDLNDLAIISKNPNIYDKLKLDNFFSIDKFDLLYLDLLVYDKISKQLLKKN